MRSFPVSEYLILYRIEQGDVLILHVVRGSRDIEGLFGRQAPFFGWRLTALSSLFRIAEE